MKTWILAARPKTLMAGLVPVGVGSWLAAKLGGEFSWGFLVLVLGSCLLIQVATNFFNDVIDYHKGADTEKRLGSKRITASGMASPRAVWIAAFVCLAGASLLAIPLIIERGWPVLAIGIPSLYFTYGYTGGPVPLAYRGLGELFVLLFFGLVAVGGTYFVHTAEFNFAALVSGTQIGLLSCVLIAINNLRDIDEDRKSAKRTFAVRFGKRAARFAITFYLLGPSFIGLYWWFGQGRPMGFALPFLAWSLAIVLVRGIWNTEPSPVYNKFLGLSALHLLMFAVFFCLGLVM